MAKKFDNFEDMFDEVKRNARKAAVSATKKAAKEISKEMHREALKALQYYYADYDPVYYERTYNLYDNVRSIIYTEESNGQEFSIVVGEKFSGDAMEQYKRKSKNGTWVITGDPNIVVNEFVKGVHPNTGKEQSASRCLNDMMEKFIDEKVEVIMEKHMNKFM